MPNNHKPVVLVLGVTGQFGKLVAEELRQKSDIHLKVATRRDSQLEPLRQKYGDAVLLDLDEPRTFPNALQGVERLFLLTGYTVAMLVQSKTITDTAVKSGLKQIVHLGVFNQPDTTDPHFAWHQMIETYVKASGIPWTNLHPNVFMQNLTGALPVVGGKVSLYCEDKKVGWVALEDVAQAASLVLREGPSKHAGNDYWFSSESLNVHDVARILSEATEHEFIALAKSPEQFMEDMKKSNIEFERWYAEGAAEFFRQVVDGRMSYIADVRDDCQKLLGRKGMTLEEWASRHKDEILRLALGEALEGI